MTENIGGAAINHTPDLLLLVDKKISFFQDMLQKTIIHVQKNKNLEILGITDVKTCIDAVHLINDKVQHVLNNINTMTTETIINELQNINNELSGLVRTYGSDSLDDLLSICFGGSSSILLTNEIDMQKLELLKKFFHPTSYKVINTKTENNNSKSKTIHFMDSFVVEKSKNLECVDISLSVKQFQLKVNGIRLYIHNSSFQKNLLICGTVDDIHLDFLNNKYIIEKKKILENETGSSELKTETFTRYLSSLTLKDYLTFNNDNDILNKYSGYINQYKILSQKSLVVTVKDFISVDLYSKRHILIQFLINSDNCYGKYLAYLLYDLLSNDVSGTVDTRDQTMLLDSFPWSVKIYFQDAMKKTIQYTNSLSNFDVGKIPIEQQICLLKAPDSVKEKAMIKLKELKAKSEDSGSKARQYLDGLLKIPFNVYIKEPIMTLMDKNNQYFHEIVKQYNNSSLFPIKEKYMSIEISNYVKLIKNKLINNNNTPNETIKNQVKLCDKSNIILCIFKINELIEHHKLPVSKLKHAQKKKGELIKIIGEFVDEMQKNSTTTNNIILSDLLKLYDNKNIIVTSNSLTHKHEEIKKKIDTVENNFSEVSSYISNVKNILDSSVHGHDKAKKQLERIIAQWINGDNSGYCFGFEGPPGVGKTSLAKKGLSDCLRDASGNSRPFSMIQMGGDSNGSTLQGHNYTYVGSTWGGIAQILIDKKCMNPIIFIDEVDKISKTENGKEIIGILTHLLDSTQNDCFQDKYFTGIDLDLSKALFILSYNDADLIDKILLDRIHRIKFGILTMEDKLIILKKHMLPEIYKKMGLEDIVSFDEDALKYIIEEYTAEPGVRKLKELIFDIVGEINLNILKNSNKEHDFPIHVTINDIKTVYFKDKHEVRIKKIHTENIVGIANGMYANAIGQGGVIPVQAKFYPCDKFLNLKLTGLVGDVMNESSNIALSLAWNLTSPENHELITNKYNGNHKCGIHVNFPEGSVNKNGPSAGSCITTVLYSLLNNKKIRYNIAMTGEISLDGCITAIGGLDHKITGSIKEGVTEFLYPQENQRDLDTFIEKCKDTELLKGIIFHPVSDIRQVFEIVFEQE